MDILAISIRTEILFAFYIFHPPFIRDENELAFSRKRYTMNFLPESLCIGCILLKGKPIPFFSGMCFLKSEYMECISTFSVQVNLKGIEGKSMA